MNDGVIFNIGVSSGVLAALLLVLLFFDNTLWIPSTKQDVEIMLRLANLQPDELLVDLGAGNGQILFHAIKTAHIRAVGVEISPLLFLLIYIKSWVFGVRKQVRVKLGDLYEADVTQADVVTLYLMPSTIEKLREKLERELKPGSRVISNRFPIHNWEPVTQEGDIYLYQR